jgi:ABC-type transport system substrate-binding protein
MIQAKQADIWIGSNPQEAADLKAMGFSVVQAPTVYHAVYCDSNDPASPFADKKVREAIEYAIDRKAMAEAVGFGFQIPVYQPTHKGTAGYNPDYPVRAYNPEKAKQLLAEAGFAKGIKTKMIAQATGTYQAGALVVQNFLAEIGIDVELDLCDVGRFWGSVMGGWKGLLFGPYAFGPEFCVPWLHTLGPEPIMRFASMAKSKKYLDLCGKLVVAPDKTAMRKLTQEMVTQAGLDCMFIPCTLTLGTSVHVANFHTGYYTALDWTYWSLWDDWMEKK